MEKPKILVVDDEPNNLQLIRQILKNEYTLIFTKSGTEGLEKAIEHSPDLILLDVLMPGLNGYEVLTRLKYDLRTHEIPVIFVTTMSGEEDEAKGFKLGAVDYISKPLRPSVVRMRVKNHLSLHNQTKAWQEKAMEEHEELLRTRLYSLQMLGRAAEFKDNETGLHVLRMSHYCQIIAREYGWSNTACDLILNASPMHDIGKIGIPDHILTKPGKLDAEEWEIMQTHPALGSKIIGSSTQHSHLFELANTIALTHHEKWNGKGYPHKLKGEEIPIAGRIVAIADVFDALTSDRPYKKAWPLEKAFELLENEAGEHFDPHLISLFIPELSQIMEIYNKWDEE